MAFLPTNASQVQQFAVALYGIQVGTATMAAVQQDITAVGGLNNALNAYYAVSFGSKTTAQVAASVAANLGLTGAALTDGTAYITAALNAAPANARGAAIQGVLNLFASIPADNATYGAAAAAWNTKVASAVAYNGSGDLAAGAGSVAVGKSFDLTASVDSLVGTDANDQFNAAVTATSAVLGGLDEIDGGAGSDTLAVVDTAVAVGAAFNLPTGISIKNVEILKVTANGSLGDSAGTAFDTTGIVGLTSVVATSNGDGTTDTSLTVANTTDLTAVASAAQTVTTLGGKVVSVTGGAAASTITGEALTSVTVKKSAGMTIDNTDTAANGSTTAVGTTLTSVTLDAVDSDTAIKGKAITTLTLKNATASTNTVTITNATTGHALTVNVDGAGYDATAAAQAQTVKDAVAAAITVNATGAKSNIIVSTGAGDTVLKTATITGSAALALDLDSTNNTALATIDGSAATGALTLTNTAVATSIKTGSGKDTFTATVVGTTKSTVDSGAGNDTVTLSGGLVAGSTVNLGAGDDTLLGTTVVSASTASAVTVIDGGDGVDSVSSGLINAGNAAQFKNFENLSISTASIDASLLTASTITGLTIDGSTGTAAISGLTQSQGLTVKANNGGTSATLTFTGVTGTADAYSIGFNATTTGTAASPTSIDAKVIGIEGIENVTINSAAAAGVVTNAVALKGTTGRTVTITGDQALNLTFNTAFGDTTAPKTGVSSIDGSAATGKLGINLANVVAATAGLVVKGGSAVDTITTIASQATTLTGNGGKDSFVVAATIAGTTDAATAYITTITDFTKGDTITFADIGNSAFTATAVDVSAAVSLDAAVDLAVAGDGSANEIVKWFVYGGNTYIAVDGSASASLAATADQIIKLNGVLDLSTSTMTTAAVLTFA